MQDDNHNGDQDDNHDGDQDDDHDGDVSVDSDVTHARVDLREGPVPAL